MAFVSSAVPPDGGTTVTFKSFSEHKFFRPGVGAALTAGCGLLLSFGTLGQRFTEASYDNLGRFGGKESPNKVLVVQMTDPALTALTGDSAALWDRDLHTRLLQTLTTNQPTNSRSAVFDVLFGKLGETNQADRLARAMREHGRVVLMEDFDVQADGNQVFEAAKSTPPQEKFAGVANALGVGRLAVDSRRREHEPVRRHWRDVDAKPGKPAKPSLPWAAAKVFGPTVPEAPGERWLRYYGGDGGLKRIQYDVALNGSPETREVLTNHPVVFIGNEPPSFHTNDLFWTPENLRRGAMVGGVELHAITFLNLINRDWLRQFPGWLEGFLLLIVGALLGVGFSHLGRFAALGVALGLALALTSAGVSLSFSTNYLFPWVIVVCGQLPCALVWAWMPAKLKPQTAPPVAPQPAPARLAPTLLAPTLAAPPAKHGTIRLSLPEEELPDAPEYEIITPAVGKGGFGKVWIARNAIGQWQALKAVHAATFGDNRLPYETEFKGLQRYKPVSEKHPGLLRIDLVSKMKPEGYFYYVMELGDAQSPGWEKQPQLYKPIDLENLRRQAVGRRLPVKECLRIVTVLADALAFLHQQGLAHRDIKPSNVIFVNGRPKLADIGLVSEIRPAEQVHTIVGTVGFMPPPPEKPGTPQADIYALGMLLYVISTGSDPKLFPDLSTTLMERSGQADFIQINAIILKACHPELRLRYQTTNEMLSDLQKTAQEFGLN